MTRRFQAFFLAICALIGVLDGPDAVRMLAKGPEAGLGARAAATTVGEARAKAELARLPVAAVVEVEPPVDVRVQTNY